MFRGVANLNLDAKGRMAMPSRHRERLIESCAGQLVITIDRDPCLLIFPLPEWEQVERKLMQLPNLNKTARSLQRLYLGHAHEVDLDGQGRMLLPTPLREVAGLGKRVVLIGQGNKFELWDEEAWTRHRDQWLEEARGSDGDELSDSLGSFSL